MAEDRIRIIRNVGVAALVVGLVLSVSLYASLSLTGGGSFISSTSCCNSITSSSSTSSSELSLSSTMSASTSQSPCLGPTKGATVPVGYNLENISIGDGFGGMAFDSNHNMLYIADSTPNVGFGNKVFVLNTTQIIESFPTNITVQVGSQPVDIAYDPNNDFSYVANFGSNSVSVINDSTNVVIKTIPVGANPDHLLYSYLNNQIYVANQGSGSVSVIDPNSNTVNTTINIGSSPSGIALDARNRNLYISDGSTNLITEINGTTNKVIGTLHLGLAANILAYDSSNSLMYAANFFDSSVYAINSTNFIVGNITIGSIPQAIGYDPANGDIYVAGNASIPGSSGYGFLYVISSSNSIADNITGQKWTPYEIIPNQSLGNFSNGVYNSVMFVTSYPHNVFILSNYASSGYTQYSSCQVVNAENCTPYSVINSIAVGEGAFGEALDWNNQYLYVAGSSSNNVSVIDTLNNTFVASIPVGRAPSGVVFDGSYIYVTDSGSNTVTVIDPASNKVAGAVSVGREPIGIDATGGMVYVANYGSGTISVLTGLSVNKTLSVGLHPFGVLADPADNIVFVSNLGSDTISRIYARSNQVVGTINLPSGSGPAGLAFDENTSSVYVADMNSSSITEINSTNFATQNSISLGNDVPIFLTYDQANSNLYTANTGSNSTTVVSTLSNSILARITQLTGAGINPASGGHPEGILYDPFNGIVYEDLGSQPILFPGESPYGFTDLICP